MVDHVSGVVTATVTVVAFVTAAILGVVSAVLGAFAWPQDAKNFILTMGAVAAACGAMVGMWRLKVVRATVQTPAAVLLTPIIHQSIESSPAIARVREDLDERDRILGEIRLELVALCGDIRGQHEMIAAVQARLNARGD